MTENSSAANLLAFLNKFLDDFEPTKRSDLNAGYLSGVMEGIFPPGATMRLGWDEVSKYIANVYYFTENRILKFVDILKEFATSTVYNEEIAKEALNNTETKITDILNNLNIN